MAVQPPAGRAQQREPVSRGLVGAESGEGGHGGAGCCGQMGVVVEVAEGAIVICHRGGHWHLAR